MANKFMKSVPFSLRIIISSLIKQLTERNRDNQQTTDKCL